jgi:glycosyltransferase involved in cell wall biosynthesis
VRILHVVPSYYPAVRYGGPIRSVHGLAAALAHRGHDVHVATTSMDGDQNLDVPVDRAVLMDGVSVHYFPATGLRRLFWSARLSTWVDHYSADFDVMHLHSVFLQPTWAGRRAARQARIPYVMSPRGMLMREVIKRRSRWTKLAWIALVEARSLRHASAVHVTAENEAEELKTLRLPLPPIRCVPNGVAWPTEPVPLHHGPFATVPRPYALFLSRISWKKGLDRLIAAWKSIPDLHLVIAGNDDEGYLPQVEAMIRDNGVGRRVHIVGPASDEHKWALYQNAQMFVLPSYSENFGNVIAEAMAMACPVIVTPDVGIAPMVVATDSGIVTSNESEKLVEAVGRLRDTKLSREMGNRGRRAAEELLSWDAIAARMETVYR